jgi:hypothetical protein
MMVLLPYGELSIAAWPIRLHAIQWRFGLVGLFGNGFIGPVTGVLLVALTAALLEHKIALRSIATFSLLIAVFALSGAGSFILDALQLRRTVKPEAHRAFDFAAGKALLGTMCAMLLSAWIGIAGWKASLRKASARRTGEATPVLISSTLTPQAPAAPATALVTEPALPIDSELAEENAAV